MSVPYQKRMGVEDSVREPRQKSMTASFRLPTPTTCTGSVAREAPSAAAAAARTPGPWRRLQLLRPREDMRGYATGDGSGRARTGAAIGDESV
jgi:hypothetical protein